MRILLLIALLVISAGALFATNPSRVVFEAEVEEILTNEIAGMTPEDANNEIEAILLATCKAGGSGCARLIRSLMDIGVQDRILYSTADLRLGQGEPIRCYGLLNKVICPGF